MGLYVQRDEKRSEFQEKLAADLKAKADKARREGDKQFDAVEDSAYFNGFKRTTSLAWLWVIVALLAVAVIAYAIVRLSNP